MLFVLNVVCQLYSIRLPEQAEIHSLSIPIHKLDDVFFVVFHRSLVPCAGLRSKRQVRKVNCLFFCR
jgi:hypothetical protein